MKPTSSQWMRTVWMVATIMTVTAVQAQALPQGPGGAAEPPRTAEVLEEAPRLPDGTMSLQQKLHDTVDYLKWANIIGSEKTIYVKFIVDETGAVVNPEIVRGTGLVLDKQILDAVSELRFVPGRENGRTVPALVRLPVKFKLK